MKIPKSQFSGNFGIEMNNCIERELEISSSEIPPPLTELNCTVPDALTELQCGVPDPPNWTDDADIMRVLRLNELR